MLGLDCRASHISPVKEYIAGAVPTAGVIVAGVDGSASADQRGTYAPNLAPDAARTFDVWYISDDPWIS